MLTWQFTLIKSSAVLAILVGAGQLIPRQLENADLAGAYLPEQHWAGAHLGNADLQHADLQSSDLRGADLTSACLSGATLRGANLARANLRLVNLCGANLRGANLYAVLFEYTMYDSYTQWPDGFMPATHPGLCQRREAPLSLLERALPSP